MSARALACILISLFSIPAGAEAPDLVIYAYDSFVAEGGLGPAILPLFEKKCACKVVALASGDGGQLVTRLQLDAESGARRAHLVLGLDEPAYARAKALLEPWGAWRPAGWKKLTPELRAEPGFLPFDYGIFALMADRKALEEKKIPAPKSLQNLLSPALKRSLLLEDPRTSTPGQAFLLYTDAVLGARVWDFWKALRTQWLTLPTGWDAAYGLFLKGEAPLVWSYTTSEAYHVAHGEKSRYGALVFDEGNPVQIEGVSIIKGALKSEKETKLARQFLEFILSDEVQRLVPSKQWMYPSVKSTRLPDSFNGLPQPRKWIPLGASAPKANELLKSWGRVVQGLSP